MKKFIFSMILTGALVFSAMLVTSLGCGSPEQIGNGHGSGSAGGTAGTPTIKLDGSISSSQGGAGGSGTSSAPPSEDANCGSQTSTTTREPPDVLLLLDRSASLFYTIEQDCFCSDEDAAASGTTNYRLCDDTANCSTRWSAVKPAVIDTVSNSKDVQWGLKFFPTPDAPQCSVSPDMEVPIGPDTADAVKSQIENATLALSTPTSAALKAASDYLKTVDDNRPKFILLATDGEPNCARGQIMNSDVPGASQAAKSSYDAGYPVFVVGIGPNLGNLTQIASSGGTNDYYPVSSPDDLVKAFADISKLIASCTFTLDEVPPDINNVGVYLDKNLVQKDSVNGWSFGGGNRTIQLNGEACEMVTSGQATEVQLLFGCPGVPPPANIP